ncbi:MAG: hypothetical protein KBB71_04910 [Lentimicrobiaceae bacterium]|nr:hypothetical protein [Lentimicrobiaceae bacterium]
MEKAREDRISLKFSSLDPLSNTVKVIRVLPDNTEESIGQIYLDFTDGEDSVKYISVNSLGEELIPATSDFIDIEHHFMNYTQEMDEKYYTEEMEAKTDEPEERVKTLRELRQLKCRWQSKFFTR